MPLHKNDIYKAHLLNQFLRLTIKPYNNNKGKVTGKTAKNLTTRKTNIATSLPHYLIRENRWKGEKRACCIMKPTDRMVKKKVSKDIKTIAW